jgi:hypothetical protein
VISNADCDIGSIFIDFIPWWNSPDTHVDLVTVDLRLSYEMSYDSRLFSLLVTDGLVY